jgi:hypothetical protein
MRYGIIILLAFVSCTSQPKTITNEIFIELSPRQLILDRKQINKGDLEKELASIIEIKLNEGFERDELIVNVKIDGETKRGDVADLSIVLRILNIKKIIYSDLNNDQSQI